VKLTGAAAKRFLAKPANDACAVLLYGPNRSMIAEAADALTAHMLGPSPDQMAITRLGEDEIRRDRALLSDQLAAQSLLGGARVLRLRADGDSAHEPIVDAISALDGGAPAAAFLIVEGGDLAAKSKIRSAFENAARCYAVVFYEEDEAALVEFAAGLIAQAKLSLTQDARDLLQAALPGDRALVRGEIEKLALYAHGRTEPVTAPEIAALLAVEAESALDDATLAVAGGDARASVEQFHHAGAGGITAIRALERRLMRLQEARLAVDNGASPTDAAGKLRPPVFWKERDAFAAHLRTWTAPRLATALDVLWRAQVRAMTAGAPQELIAAEAFRAVANMANRR
jgi:DNA polymerase III subunit delta